MEFGLQIVNIGSDYSYTGQSIPYHHKLTSSS